MASTSTLPTSPTSPTWLSADEAADRLGVSKATLYAYVSRGRVQRRLDDTGRRSLFDADEIARVTRRMVRSQRPGSIDLRLDSAITKLDESSLAYRGTPIRKLVGSSTFEAAAEHLWQAPAGAWECSPEAIDAAARVWAEQADPWVRSPGTTSGLLASAVLALGRLDDYRTDLRPEAVIGAARSMISALTMSLPGVRRADRSVATRLWRHLARRAPKPGELELIEAALVLLADHELATSTFAVRLAASTRADPYASVVAGLAVGSGPLHCSASAAAVALLDDAHRTARPARALAERLAEARGVAGFGHKVYKAVDPRCSLLLELLDRADVDRRRRSTVSALLAESADRVPSVPNVDLGLAAVSFCCGLPPSSGELIFGVARIAGWIAHALEELDERPLRFRVRAVYRGA